MKLSLSTAYHISRNNSAEELVDDTLQLGFSALELNYEFPKDWIPDLKKQIQLNRIEIVSLHNYCPCLESKPEGRTLLNAFLISSLDIEERKQSIELTKKTINYAAELGARAVVIHAGEVEYKPNGKDLYYLARDKGTDNQEYKNLFENVIKERKNQENFFLENTLNSLEELAKYAESKEILIGLENRFYYNEIPLPEEVEFLLNHLGSNVGYWHDIGHSEVLVRMGLISHQKSFLDQVRGRLIGIHLHDLIGLSDHHAPGTGNVDYSVLKPYLKNSHTLYVEEIHSSVSESDVKASIGYLQKVMTDDE